MERIEIPEELHRRMFEIARELRRRSTPGEDTLWEQLRNRRFLGRKFRRQHAIGPFVVDFYCPSERLVVEVDGDIHETEEQRGADRERQEMLEAVGLRVIRINDELVQSDVVQALARIESAFHFEDTVAAPAPPLRSTERGPGGEVPC